jgi:hypothetical protein
LAFGDLGNCGPSDTAWDYFSYDAFDTDDVPSDEDEDGVDDSLDDCVFIADPEQLDSDADGPGDPCDICPQDATNDADGDGFCAPRDPCPQEVNGRDEDGGIILAGEAGQGCAPPVDSCTTHDNPWDHRCYTGQPSGQSGGTGAGVGGSAGAGVGGTEGDDGSYSRSGCTAVRFTPDAATAFALTGLALGLARRRARRA